MADVETRKASSPLKDALRLFVRNKPALISFVMILLLALAAITGSVMAGKRADANDLIRMEEAELVGDRFKTEAIKSAVLDPQKSELKDTFERPYVQTVLAAPFGGFEEDSEEVIREKYRQSQLGKGMKEKDIVPLTDQDIHDLRKEGLSHNREKTYWLGTDHLGRDVLARLWSGSSISLTIGFLAVGISVFLGITLGGISGYFGRSRVGLSVFATLLLFLAGGILLATEMNGAAWTCFGIGGALFALQFAIACVGARWRTVGFFSGAALLFGLVTAYNHNIETNTPQGALYQEATTTYREARELLLEVRDFGRRVKEFEDSDKDNLKNIVDQDKPDAKKLPEWLYDEQLELEVRFRLLEIRVARFELEKYRSANREAQILHTNQQARADLLEEYIGDYEERNQQALGDEKAARTESGRLFKLNDREGGREMAEKASNHAARAATFDPVELKKRIRKLREVGVARQKYVESVISAMEKHLENRLAAMDTAREALSKVSAGQSADKTTMRARQFELEAAMREWKLAEAAFGVADALARLESLATAQQTYAKAGSDRAVALKDLGLLLKDYQASLTAFDDAFAASLKDAKAGETKQKAADEKFGKLPERAGQWGAKWAELIAKPDEKADLGQLDLDAEMAGALKKLGAALAAKDAAQKNIKALNKVIEEEAAAHKLADEKAKEAALAGTAKNLPMFKVQGSNDLIDRRGRLRTGYVIKFDTELKNDRTALRVAEGLDGHYTYKLFRFTSHFLTATFMYLLLIVAALALMASAQASVIDSKWPFKALYVPTITVDDLVMRFTEIMMTIPVIFLILAILAIFEKDVFITMGVIGLTSWMGTTRFVRAEILSLREQDFVQAARSLGLSDFRIIWRHLVPNAISPVLVSATLGVAGAVLAESTLSFLGIGAKPEQTTWGQILSEGREYIFDAPWLTWIPGVAILITVLSFNLLGEGLREAFNPKLRGR